MSALQLLQTLQTDGKHSYHLSLFSQLCALPSYDCLWHSLFSDLQRSWVETQCSQPWEAGFQVVVDSAFWILVEWSGMNAFSYTGYIGLSFLERDSWGQSLTPHYPHPPTPTPPPPHSHSCSFLTDIVNLSTSSWGQHGFTICLCDTNIMASLHAFPLKGAGEGSRDGKCASWHQWCKPRQWWTMAQTGRKKGGCW